MRVAIAALLAFVLLGGNAAPSSATQPTAPPGMRALTVEEVQRGWKSLDARQRGAVVEQLIAAGQFETAEQMIADFGADTPVHRSTARFLTGVLRNAQGQRDEAIAIYRELLAANPEFARVRLLLAIALFQKQEDDGARHHFELVMGSSTNTELHTTINRFVDQINQRKRLTFATHFSLVPSTNYNQGTDTRVVTINGLDFQLDPNAVRHRGVGVASGFSAAYRAPVTDRLDFVVGGGAQSRVFRQSAFTDWTTVGELGPRYRFDWADIGLYGTASRRWLGGEDWYGGRTFSVNYGMRLHARVRIDHSSIIDTNFLCSEKRFDHQYWQDGWNCAVNAAMDHYFDSRTFFRLLGGVEHEVTGRPWLDYDAGNVGLGAYREIMHGLSVYGQVLYSRRVYGADFPVAGIPRVDNRMEGTVQVTKRDWYVKGLAPMLQYSYVRNFSNISFYDFDAHNLNLTLTRSF